MSKFAVCLIVMWMGTLRVQGAEWLPAVPEMLLVDESLVLNGEVAVNEQALEFRDAAQDLDLPSSPFQYRQWYRNLPVWGGGVSPERLFQVVFSQHSAGRVLVDIHRDLPSLSPVISPVLALRLANRYPVNTLELPRLWIVVDRTDRARLAYQIHQDVDTAKALFVDAHTGRRLSLRHETDFALQHVHIKP